MTEYIPIEEFLKIANSEQKKLLDRLYILAIKERDIDTKIRRIYDSIEKGVYHDGVGLTVCETEEDAMIISMSSRKELVVIRAEIISELKKAVNELKMGDVGIIQRQYKNYVGEGVDGKK